jgi:hypothetical protein
MTACVRSRRPTPGSYRPWQTTATDLTTGGGILLPALARYPGGRVEGPKNHVTPVSPKLAPAYDGGSVPFGWPLPGRSLAGVSRPGGPCGESPPHPGSGNETIPNAPNRPAENCVHEIDLSCLPGPAQADGRAGPRERDLSPLPTRLPAAGSHPRGRRPAAGPAESCPRHFAPR